MPRFIDPFAPAAGRKTPAPTPQPTGKPGEEPRDPARMKVVELRAWAKDLGLDDDGTKAELVARIRAAV